jgi:integrase
MNHGQGRNRKGYLYRRWQKKKYDVDDTSVAGKGVFYLRYMVDGKIIEQSLKTANADEAKKIQASIMKPLELANKKEVLLQTQVRLIQNDKDQQDEREKQTPPLKLADAWAAYLASTERPDTGPDTLRYYQIYWTHFLEWFTEQNPSSTFLRDVHHQAAQAYAAKLTTDKLTGNTYNKHVGFLRLFFRVLEAPGRITENPFDRIQKKKLRQNSRRELTIAELKTILTKASGELQTLFYIGTFTGLRLGDCCTLKWSEVDLDRQLIRRVPNKTGRSGKPVLIGIPPVLLAKLQGIPTIGKTGYLLPKYADLYTRRNTDGVAFKQPEISNEIREHFHAYNIATVKDGTGFIKKIDPKTGETETVHSGKRGIVEVGFHSLRHTYVSLHAEAGTPQALIQANVGHRNPAMTAHYTHIGEAAAVQAAKALDFSPSHPKEKDSIYIDWKPGQVYDASKRISA